MLLKVLHTRGPLRRIVGRVARYAYNAETLLQDVRGKQRFAVPGERIWRLHLECGHTALATYGYRPTWAGARREARCGKCLAEGRDIHADRPQKGGDGDDA